MSTENKLKAPSKKTRYWWIILPVVAILAVLGGWFLMGKIPVEASPVDIKKSLVERQLEQNKLLENTEYSFDDPKVVVNPYEISPLSAVILFKTDQPQAPEIKIIGKDELSTFEHKFEENTKHRLPIYGLYAGQKNKVELRVGDKVKHLEIETEKLPEKFPKVISVNAKKEYLNSDLYFMTGSSRDAKTIAYDVNGDVRWYLTEKFGWEIKRSKQSGRLLLGTERIISAPYYNTGIYEVDLLGKIYNEFTLPGGYHHDYFERENGNLIVASGSFEEGRKTVEDIVVEIDRKTGEIIKEIDFTKIWPTNTGKSIAWSEYDWFHNNSVWLDEKSGELILSGRHQDAVVVLDYKSGELKYIIGSPDGWSDDMKKYFLKPEVDDFEWQWQQHAAKFLPNGDVIIFDNGNNKTKDAKKAVPAENGYSRAVIYRVDQEKMTIQQIWQYGKERGAEYYSPYISEADYLGENHFLVHSGGVNYKDGKPTNKPASIAGANQLKSYTTEVLDGQVIFELVNDQNNYRAEKMPIYSKFDQSLELDKAKHLGRPMKSQVRSNIPIDKAKKADKEYQGYDIKLTREYDRLVMSGEFDKKDIVRLALVNEEKQLTYDMPVEKRGDSAAMCIDIMNYDHEKSGETKRVTNYVNSNDLSGKYRIYISVGDTIYDTAKEVIF